MFREIAGGSKRITEVYEAFHSSAETLEQQAKTYGVSTQKSSSCKAATTTCLFAHDSLQHHVRLATGLNFCRYYTTAVWLCIASLSTSGQGKVGTLTHFSSIVECLEHHNSEFPKFSHQGCMLAHTYTLAAMWDIGMQCTAVQCHMSH